MSVVCVVLLIDEFPYIPTTRRLATAPHRNDGIVFQETAVTVSVIDEMVISPQGHRRLRFSFQINDFKDRPGFPEPAVYARRRRGGGALEKALSRVNRTCERNSLIHKNRRIWSARNSPGPEGSARQRRGDSIEGAVFSHQPRPRQAKNDGPAKIPHAAAM